MLRSSSHRRSANRGASKRTGRSARRLQRFEQLESRMVLSAVPLNAQPLDTGEFMLGDVSVTVVFFESNGNIDPSTEDWTLAHTNEVKGRIEEGLQWWVDALALQSSVHELNFEIDYQYADNPISIGIEPINRVATDLEIWVGEFLDEVGAERTGKIDDDVRLFNHSQRVANDTNWAFTIFVINAQNDFDGLFPAGNAPRGAFSIAGGSFLAVPSERPASTIAHEVSHQFWAMDEYAGSGNYDDVRGYYATQNTNAIDGNPQPASRETSLLRESSSLQVAYANHTSSTSSFETIGWKDSDDNGIFDVFDVPISFSATSQFDPSTSRMRINGSASIGVLPNQNSWGLQNSVTINRLSHIEFRLDGGAWVTGPSIDDYTADFDFLIQLPDANAHELEVRIVDKTGLIHSQSLVASTTHIDSTAVHGFTGYVTYDENDDGMFNAGEQGLAGWIVEVVDQAGNPQVTQTFLEPDDYPAEDLLYGSIGGVTLRAEGSEISLDFPDVSSRVSSLASTGTQGFFNHSDGSWSNLWSEKRQLNISFDSPVSRVAIDAIAQNNGDVGILELYDSLDNLLGRYTTNPMAAGTSETMVVELDLAEATYAIARGHLTAADNPRRSIHYVGLDNLQVGRPHTAITDQFGAFTLPFDIDGNYRLKVTAPNGKDVYFTTLTQADVTLTQQAGMSRIAWSVSIADDAWHNPLNAADVNRDGQVDPMDFDLVLSELVNPQFTSGGATQSRMLHETRTSGDPYLDLNADGQFNKLDLLYVSNAIAFHAQSGQAFAPEPTSLLTYSVALPTLSGNNYVAQSPTTETPISDVLEGEGIAPELGLWQTNESVTTSSTTIEHQAPSSNTLPLELVFASQDSAIIDSVDNAYDHSFLAKPLDEEAIDAVLSDLDDSLDLL